MKFFVSFLFLLSCCAAQAQYMFDYSDIVAGRFAEKTVSGVRSMNDGERYTVMDGGRIEKYGYKTGEKLSTVFDASKFTELEGGFSDYAFSPDERKILLTTRKKQIYRRSYTADHWIYDIDSGQLRRLTEEGDEQVPCFSPDGAKVGFVRDNDLYCVDISVPQPWSVQAVTSDGARNEIINGHTDWVYEEEFAFTRAFEFSPDGKYIAYLRFDEREVPQYAIMKYTGDSIPRPFSYKYPRAGEKNSVVELWIYSFGTGGKNRVDTGNETDQYISRIGWVPSGELFFYRTNRVQNHFEVILTDTATGATRKIYDERDTRYVERQNGETITFLPKGDRFIVKNETSGNMHLYLYSIKNGVTDTLTRGNWDVTKLVGATSDRVYYISNEGSPLRRNFYSVRLNGKGKAKLTDGEGVFDIAPSEGFKYFISWFSNSSTPNLVRLHDASGKVLRTLEDNADLKKTVEERRVPRKEFFTFTTERGTVLNGYMIKPYDFKPDRKYPVLMTQYSGPGSQQVLDRWTLDWTDVLVQEGYIVACVDGRGTGGRGAAFKKVTYGNLGGPETEDQISAAKYMARQPYADMERIGIYGWSYGGFMALNCILKGNDIFKMAIAVAPVSSWRFYDTIYTELYNGTPLENPDGYDENSPLAFAANLKGKLLLVHGSADDNVHLQNTMAMAGELVKAGRQFDMMIYPDDNHSMTPSGNHHVREMMIRYTLDNL